MKIVSACDVVAVTRHQQAWQWRNGGGIINQL